MQNDTSTTATSSPYPSRPESATYHPDLAQIAFSQRPPQGAPGKRPDCVLLSHLTFLWLLLGPWAQHGRSLAIPTARGPMDHQHPQHPPPPHFLHPAYYQLPHPGMLYSYIAHPYPPPPPTSSPPDSSSRKRAAPDEPPVSRSKRKRSNARDAAECKLDAVQVYWI